MAKFVIEIQTRGFSSAKRNLADVSNQSRKFARESNAASNATAVMRKEVSQLRNNMLLYTFAIGGSVAALGSFVRAASAASEQASKFKIVFGEFAPEAELFAQSIHDNFGIAKSEMMTLMATMQDTFVPLGFSREHAKDLSIALSQLALDVGSLNDRMTSEVANAFTSAIVGNHEAVRLLGIQITEAGLKQEAFNLGLVNGNEELSMSDKILSRMSIIYKGSADAQDNLNKTQDEFAHRLRATRGRLITLQQSFGDFLTPFAKITLSFIDFMATSRRAGIVVAGLTVAMIAYAKASIAAALAQIKFNAAIKRNILIASATAIAFGLEIIASKLGLFADATEKANVEAKKADEVIKKLTETNLDFGDGAIKAAKALQEQQKEEEKLANTILQSENNLLLKIAVMQKDTDLGRAAARARILENRELTLTETLRIKAISFLKAEKKAQEDLMKATKERIAAEAAEQQKLLDIENQNILLRLELNRVGAEASGVNENELLQIDLKNKHIKDLIKISQDYGLNVVEINKNLRDGTTLEQQLTDELVVQGGVVADHVQLLTNLNFAHFELARSEVKTTEKTTDLRTSNEKLADGFHAANEALMLLQSSMDTFETSDATALEKLAVLLQVGGKAITIAGKASANPGASAIGEGISLFGSVLGLTGHQGGAVTRRGIKRYHSGGMIGDEVPAILQTGEFVMSRNAVQNIGMNNLQNMNAGTTSPNVNVNIAGNLIGNREFVRDVLVPEIKNSINRA